MAYTTLTHSLAVSALVLAACTEPAVDDPTGSEGSSDPTATSSPMTTVDPDTGSETSASGSASVSSTTMTTTTDPSAGTSSETGDPECGVGAVCGVDAPPGWFGPTIFARVGAGEEPPACPETYPSGGPSVLEGYHDPGPAICNCTCDLSAAQSCSAYMYSHSTASCQEYLQYSQLTENCSNVNVSGYATAYAYLQNQPFCMQEKTEEFPPVPWDATVFSCKQDDAQTACGDGGVCTALPPEGFEAELCIYKQGDTPCPEGEYANKLTFYTSVEDSRDCTNCTCGQAPTTCAGSMQVFTGADCAGDPVANVPGSGACTAASGGSVAFSFDSAEGCPIATAPEPTGTIAPIGEFTFCCQG